MQTKNSCLMPWRSERSALNVMIHPKTINRIVREGKHSVAGAPAVLKAHELMASLVYHAMQPVGTLGAHTREATGKKMSDSALSERRQNLEETALERIMAEALKPVARREQESTAFYQQWRLVALDGTEFSLRNTPAILERINKVASRRLRAAFAKLNVVVLMELGVHNPLALAVGRDGESEMKLARRLVYGMPTDSLFLGDRYYGVGPVVDLFLPLHEERGVEILVRVKERIGAKILETLADGSALVEVRAGKQRHLVREIRGLIQTRDGRGVRVRLWTTLLDARKHPALALLRLYAQRWEQEIGYKELKVELHGGDLLQSQTVETAAQEIAALVLAQAVLVRVRQRAGRAAGVLRISFVKTLDVVRKLWWFVALAEDLLPAGKMKLLVNRAMRRLAEQISAPRRARACPRAVRQPVSSWPRLLKNTSETGPIYYKLIPVKL
jgi:hypothetical protein